MKKIIFIYIILSLFLPFSVFADEKPRVAVMLFSAGEGISKSEAKYLTDRVRTGLIKTELFDVISNDQIQAMLRVKQSKQQLGAGSCTSEKCIIDLGNALECEKMIVGSAAGAFKEFTISIKMLDVVKQKYEIAEEISLKSKDDFPDAARRIVKLIAGKKSKQIKPELETVIAKDTSPGATTYTGMIWRSVLIPGWGHYYGNQTRGYIYGGLWAGAGGAFLWSHMSYTAKNDDYLAADTDFNSKYDSMNSARKLRGYLSFAFLGVYLITLSDALITGKSYTASATETDTSATKVNFQMYYGSSADPYSFRSRKEEKLRIILNIKF